MQSWFFTSVLSTSSLNQFAQPLQPLTSKLYSASKIYSPRPWSLQLPITPYFYTTKHACNSFFKQARSTWPNRNSMRIIRSTWTKEMQSSEKGNLPTPIVSKRAMRVRMRDYGLHLLTGSQYLLCFPRVQSSIPGDARVASCSQPEEPLYILPRTEGAPAIEGSAL